MGKRKRSPNLIVTHKVNVGTIICTKVAGRIHPPGENGENININIYRHWMQVQIRATIHNTGTCIPLGYGGPGICQKLIWTMTGVDPFVKLQGIFDQCEGASSAQCGNKHLHDDSIQSGVKRYFRAHESGNHGWRQSCAVNCKTFRYVLAVCRHLNCLQALILVHAPTGHRPSNLLAKTAFPLPRLLILGQMGII